MIELIEEKIAHMQTRQSLWQVQGQLLGMMAQAGQAELDALQAQLAELKAKDPSAP